MYLQSFPKVLQRLPVQGRGCFENNFENLFKKKNRTDTSATGILLLFIRLTREIFFQFLFLVFAFFCVCVCWDEWKRVFILLAILLRSWAIALLPFAPVSMTLFQICKKFYFNVDWPNRRRGATSLRALPYSITESLNYEYKFRFFFTPRKYVGVAAASLPNERTNDLDRAFFVSRFRRMYT